VPCDQDLELGDDVRVPAELELCVDEVLARRQLELLEPADLRRGERLVGEVGERRTAEQRQGGADQLRALLSARRASLCDELLEAGDVDLLRRDRQLVAAVARLDHVTADQLAQLRHVVLERVHRAPRRVLPPDELDEQVLRHVPPGPQCEHGEERTRLLPVRREHALALDDLQRAQQADLQHGALLPRQVAGARLAAVLNDLHHAPGCACGSRSCCSFC
jgi:hypothetical protein